MKLLFHCCEFEVDTLDPASYRENAICLSEKKFVGCLGHFLYIFDYEVLIRNFNMRELPTQGMDYWSVGHDQRDYNFRSQPLGKEYRIHQTIDVGRFALGVAENFNVLTGEFTEAIMGEVQSREIIHLKSRR